MSAVAWVLEDFVSIRFWLGIGAGLVFGTALASRYYAILYSTGPSSWLSAAKHQ